MFAFSFISIYEISPGVYPGLFSLGSMSFLNIFHPVNAVASIINSGGDNAQTVSLISSDTFFILCSLGRIPAYNLGRVSAPASFCTGCNTVQLLPCSGTPRS